MILKVNVSLGFIILSASISKLQNIINRNSGIQQTLISVTCWNNSFPEINQSVNDYEYFQNERSESHVFN